MNAFKDDNLWKARMVFVPYINLEIITGLKAIIKINQKNNT